MFFLQLQEQIVSGLPEKTQWHEKRCCSSEWRKPGRLGPPLAGIQPSALADEVSVVHNAGAAAQAGVGGTRVDAHLAVGPDVQGVAFCSNNLKPANGNQKYYHSVTQKKRSLRVLVFMFKWKFGSLNILNPVRFSIPSGYKAVCITKTFHRWYYPNTKDWRGNCDSIKVILTYPRGPKALWKTTFPPHLE